MHDNPIANVFSIDVRFPVVILLSVFIVMGSGTMRNLGQMDDSQIRVIGRDSYSARRDIRRPWALALHPYVQHVIIRGDVRNVKTSSRPLHAKKGGG